MKIVIDIPKKDLEEVYRCLCLRALTEDAPEGLPPDPVANLAFFVCMAARMQARSDEEGMSNGIETRDVGIT